MTRRRWVSTGWWVDPVTGPMVIGGTWDEAAADRRSFWRYQTRRPR